MSGSSGIAVRLLPVSAASRDSRFLSQWAELEREALEPNPFFAPQMVLPAARHLEDEGSPHLLVAESHDGLLFLMPVSGQTALRDRSFPGLRSWMHDYCFLGTPLVAAHGDPGRTLTTIFQELRRSRLAPLLVMQLLPADGPVVAALGCAGEQAALRVRRSPVAHRGFVRRRPEPAYVDEWVSKRNRKALARRRRDLRRRLDAELCTVDRAAADLEDAVERFLRLEASGWKGRSGTALLCRPGHDRFFREMSRGFADQDRLMFLSLQAGSQVLAQSTALLAGRGLFGLKRAYDEAFGRWSPGTLLDLEVLTWFHRLPQLDFLDTCSATDDGATGRVFGDRLAVCAMAVPLSSVGSAAAAMLPATVRARRYLRDSGPGRIVRQYRRVKKRG
jgi:CelD/BcsL family acetyltransferase involved in cellulose biosynthesis